MLTQNIKATAQSAILKLRLNVGAAPSFAYKSVCGRIVTLLFCANFALFSVKAAWEGYYMMDKVNWAQRH